MSKFLGVKTNNAKTNAKSQLRREVFDAIKGERHTLEVFCGAGEMYQEVWKDSDSYLGIDKVKFFDKRDTMCGDARKCIRRADIDRFNIFDIDAYGSPYEVLSDILQRIGKHKTIGFVLTDGTNMDLKLGRISKGMREFTGIDFHLAKRAHVLHDEFIHDVINSVEKRLNGSVTVKRIARGRTGSAMRYYGFVVNRDAD